MPQSASLTHPRSAPVEIPSGPRAPPPGAGAFHVRAGFRPCPPIVDTGWWRCRTSAGDRNSEIAAIGRPQHNRYRVRVALGRTKANRQRKPAEEAEPDPEFESYLAALDPEDNPETTGSGRRFGAAQVYQLRLPLLANERLRELAFKQGTSPAALARDWVMQHLEIAEEEHAAQPQAHQPAAQAPAWPGQDGPYPDNTPDPMHAGLAGGIPDVEQTEEMTVPVDRYRPM